MHQSANTPAKYSSTPSAPTTPSGRMPVVPYAGPCQRLQHGSRLSVRKDEHVVVVQTEDINEPLHVACLHVHQPRRIREPVASAQSPILLGDVSARGELRHLAFILRLEFLDGFVRGDRAPAVVHAELVEDRRVLHSDKPAPFPASAVESYGPILARLEACGSLIAARGGIRDVGGAQSIWYVLGLGEEEEEELGSDGATRHGAAVLARAGRGRSATPPSPPPPPPPPPPSSHSHDSARPHKSRRLRAAAILLPTCHHRDGRRIVAMAQRKVEHEGAKHSSKPSASLAPTTPLPMPSDRTAATSIALYAAYASPSSRQLQIRVRHHRDSELSRMLSNSIILAFARTVYLEFATLSSNERSSYGDEAAHYLADNGVEIMSCSSDGCEAKINRVKINRLSQGVSEGLQIGYSDALGGVPAIVVEMALYSINLSLSITTAIVLLRRSTGEGLVHRWFLIMLITMFIIATVIWRCYKVFGKSIIVVLLPALTALATFVMGVYLASLNDQPFMVSWTINSWIWATMTMVCTVYCAAAISYKIYLSARLSKSSNLVATIFFVVETSLIYTLGIVAYVTIGVKRTTYDVEGIVDIQDLIMGIVVQLPPIVLCLLLLQIKLYNSGSHATWYTNPEPARPWAAVRHFFRTGREGSANGDISTFRVASVAVHMSTHTISMPAAAPSMDAVDDMSDEDDLESDVIRQWVKKVTDVLNIA
ncbi:hypothetical protein EVG20_g7596 [Dentipellis fragilis]|uniref:Uncharacterized protein n=1 Tax=Dentipellis fragilis TaxID=205917 RepID=A0A4Y9YBM7_9AGAM|nr:hypothetical protein EVG20_g7596 [Dentipellis fragilis]